MSRPITPLRSATNARVRQTGVLLSVVLIAHAMDTAGAQQPGTANVLDFQQIGYEQIELPQPDGFTAPHGGFAAPQAGQQAAWPPSPKPLAQRPLTAAAACDEPGAIAPPCPPTPQVPPKRQVHHVYVQPSDCPPAAQPPAYAPGQEPPMRQPPGAFVAPPQAGTVVQEQRSVGLRGMRITFPAFTFELPSIELPHWIRRGKAAHMELAAATAPYVAATGVAQAPVQRLPTPPPQRQVPPPPQHAPPKPPAADHPSLQKDFDELQLRCQRLEELLEKMIQCQQQTTGLLPAPPYCPPTPGLIPQPQLPCPPTAIR